MSAPSREATSALTITDSQGNIIYDQQGYPNLTIDYIDLCLDPNECYTATMSNIAGGTSWNGGYFWINAAGGEWANGVPLKGPRPKTLNSARATIAVETPVAMEAATTSSSAVPTPAPSTTTRWPMDDGSCLYDEPDSLTAAT